MSESCIFQSLAAMSAGSDPLSLEPYAAPGASLTVEQAALQITRGEVWWSNNLGQGTTITYGFRFLAPDPMPNGTSGFSLFNADQIVATEWALQSWSDVADLTFKRQGSGTTGDDAFTDNATILFSNYSSGPSGTAAFAYFPSSKDRSAGSIEGDVFVNASQSDNFSPAFSNYGQTTLTHEIGHALGLAHPGDYDASGGVPTYSNNAAYIEDTRQYSVMSYFSETYTGADFGGWYPAAPLMHDIAAVQRYYGANDAAFSGDTTYGFGHADEGDDYRPWYDAAFMSLVFCAYDTGGRDTFDFSGYSVEQRIDLNAGPDHFSNVGGLRGNVSIYPGVVIENAKGGTAADVILGNGAANRLVGGDGDDSLTGGAGKDTLIGGSGDDVYGLDDALDTIMEDADGGWDRVMSTVSASLSANLEQLELVGGAAIDGQGNDGDNIIIGNAAANSINGGAGDDTLDGGGGADTLRGGGGADVYLIGDPGASIVEAGTEIDEVRTSLSAFTLTGGLEILNYVGKSDFRGEGNDLANLMTGGRGDDTLVGGLGDDTLLGGGGDDVYLINDLGDRIREKKGAGTDTILTTLAKFTILGGVERLKYAGADDFRGIGGKLADQIIGGKGDDTLSGRQGDDTLTGGDGNDTYIVDGAGDVVNEGKDRGVDTVLTSGHYVLGAHLENLIYKGASAAVLQGNILDNLIVGGRGNDVLFGRGGVDTLRGGAGDDTYHVESGDAVVEERQGQGIDRVYATGSYRLGRHIEKLSVNGSVNTPATTWINGWGNDLANEITGSDWRNALYGEEGADTLRGYYGDDVLHGGRGDDSLIGGWGDDVYYVDSLKDRTIELANQGSDTVRTTLNHYGVELHIEKLVFEGVGDFYGWLNGMNGTVVGGAGDDTIGGSGSQLTLIGADGDDVFRLQGSGTYQTLNYNIVERADGGNDTVTFTAFYGLVDYTLDRHVENAIGYLNNANQRTYYFTGNNLDNYLFGGEWMRGEGGDDTLVGTAANWFGQQQTLTGGAGSDIFLFELALESSSWAHPLITDFDESDFIALDRDIYTALGNEVKGRQFILSDTGARDADDRLIYESDGDLWYDPDGSASNSQLYKIATLQGAPALSAADFLVV